MNFVLALPPACFQKEFFKSPVITRQRDRLLLFIEHTFEAMGIGDLVIQEFVDLVAEFCRMGGGNEYSCKFILLAQHEIMKPQVSNGGMGAHQIVGFVEYFHYGLLGDMVGVGNSLHVFDYVLVFIAVQFQYPWEIARIADIHRI